MSDSIKRTGVRVVLVFVDTAVPRPGLANRMSRAWWGFPEMFAIAVAYARNPTSSNVSPCKSSQVPSHYERGIKLLSTEIDELTSFSLASSMFFSWTARAIISMYSCIAKQ